jgi:hypothetical protein
MGIYTYCPYCDKHVCVDVTEDIKVNYVDCPKCDKEFKVYVQITAQISQSEKPSFPEICAICTDERACLTDPTIIVDCHEYKEHAKKNGV